jgi:hemerythrin-like domain-containing protein
MRVTDVLYNEHRVIERVLDALEAAADQLEHGEPVRPGFFLEAADFISGFADGCHHHKEEGVLFGAMIEHGAPAHGGAIEMMLEEHVQGRQFNRGIRDGALRLIEGDPAAIGKIVSNARGYVALLRDHIAKEEEMLFPMADELIPADATESLLAAYSRVEQEDGRDAHERFMAMAELLEKEALALRAQSSGQIED